MKLLVKTLTGGKFDVEVQESNSVAEVKTIIVSSTNHQSRFFALQNDDVDRISIEADLLDAPIISLCRRNMA